MLARRAPSTTLACMIRLALLLILLAPAAGAQPATRSEAEAILRQPLAATHGRAEAERVMGIAVGNGIMRHCRWRWQPNFDALMAQHREALGQPEAQMQRLAIWHGAWQGQAQQVAKGDNVPCDDALRATLRAQARALLERGPAR